MVHAGLGWLAAADAAALAAETQARCLRMLEQASSMTTAARAVVLAAIRRAVILRDQHCRFPGGCDQPAAGCEVHHLTHKADGGKTSVKDCALFCWFHHQIVIHQWGWTVVLNPDGTTTAWNKDKTKVLHSHSPPARPG